MTQTENTRPENAFCYRCPALRLGEFDVANVLYHASYLHLLEQAREAALREFGCPYPELALAEQHLTVSELHQHFRRPVFYGQQVSVYLWTTELKRSSVKFCYEIVVHESACSGKPEAPETIAHTAWTKQVFVARISGHFRTGRFPEKLLKVLQQLNS